MTYDAVALVLSVIQKQGSLDSSAIRDGLAAVGDYTGATGTIRFAGRPDPERSVVIVRLSGGKSELYRLVNPELREP